MANWYIINRFRNKFDITNPRVDTLYVSLFHSKTCADDSAFTVVHFRQPIRTRETREFNLTQTEGLYKIVLETRPDEVEAGVNRGRFEQLFIPMYNTTLSDVLSDVEHVLCGCPCVGPDCDGESMNLVGTILKLLSFNTLSMNKYGRNLESTAICMSCELFDIFRCQAINSAVLGMQNQRAFLQQWIAYYWYVLYLTDLNWVRDANEEDVRRRFNFSTIFPCVRAILGDAKLRCIERNLAKCEDMHLDFITQERGANCTGDTELVISQATMNSILCEIEDNIDRIDTTIEQIIRDIRNLEERVFILEDRLTIVEGDLANRVRPQDIVGLHPIITENPTGNRVEISIDPDSIGVPLVFDVTDMFTLSDTIDFSAMMFARENLDEQHKPLIKLKGVDRRTDPTELTITAAFGFGAYHHKHVTERYTPDGVQFIDYGIEVIAETDTVQSTIVIPAGCREWEVSFFVGQNDVRKSSFWVDLNKVVRPFYEKLTPISNFGRPFQRSLTVPVEERNFNGDPIIDGVMIPISQITHVTFGDDFFETTIADNLFSGYTSLVSTDLFGLKNVVQAASRSTTNLEHGVFIERFVLSNCPMLKRINLTPLSNVVAFNQLLNNCNSLTTIRIDKDMEATLLNGISNNMSLIHVDIGRFVKVERSTGTLLSNNRSLKSLDTTGMTVREFPAQFGMGLRNQIISSNQSLTTVNLSGFRNLEVIQDVIFISNNSSLVEINTEELVSLKSIGSRGRTSNINTWSLAQFLCGNNSLLSLNLPLRNLEYIAGQFVCNNQSLVSVDTTGMAEGSLQMSSFFGNNFSELVMFVCHNRNLKNINLSGLESLEDIPQANIQFLHHNSSLETVDLTPLSGMKMIGGFNRIQGFGNSGFLSHCTSLVNIDLRPLRWLEGIPDNFLNSCTSLKGTLDFTEFTNCTYIGTGFLAYSGIEQVNLSGFTNVEWIGGSSIIRENFANWDTSPPPPATITQFENINRGFLEGVRGMTTINLSPLSQVKEIGRGFMAFNDIEVVQGMSFQNLEVLYQDFFRHARNLLSLDISSLTSLRNNTAPNSFLHGVGVTSIDLSPLNYFTSIGNWFLSNSRRLTTVDLTPLSNVTSIGNNFLSLGSEITHINTAGLQNVETIGSSFMSGLSNLTSINLSSLTGIIAGNNMLSGNTSLVNIDLPTGMFTDTIPSNFLTSCISLQSLDLSPLSNIKYINMNFISNLRALQSLDTTVLTNLEEIVFATGIIIGCWELQNVNISNLDGKFDRVPTSIFNNCRSLKQVRVPHFGSIPVGGINNQPVNYLEGMTSLEDIDISGYFGVQQIINIPLWSTFLNGAPNLHTVRVGQFTGLPWMQNNGFNATDPSGDIIASTVLAGQEFRNRFDRLSGWTVQT